MCGGVFDFEKVYDGTQLIKLYHMGTKGKIIKDLSYQQENSRKRR